jgi:phosphoglycolate phosphatase
MKVDAVCIDLDGTLLDTIPDLAAATNAMLADLGCPALPLESVRRFVGKGAEVLIARSLEAAGLGAAPGDPVFDEARTFFYRNYTHLNGSAAEVYEGVREGLEGLRGLGLRMACVTNKPSEFVAPLLQRFRIDHYFDFAIGGDTLPFKKPHPGQLLEACRRWELEPAQVVAVGDSNNDAQAARAAGMRVFLVPYGYNEGRGLDAENVDGIVGSIAELPRLIQGLNARAR